MTTLSIHGYYRGLQGIIMNMDPVVDYPGRRLGVPGDPAVIVLCLVSLSLGSLLGPLVSRPECICHCMLFGLVSQSMVGLQWFEQKKQTKTKQCQRVEVDALSVRGDRVWDFSLL